jgi:hypothetical protein
MNDEITAVKDEVKIQRALAVLAHQVAEGSTIREACVACDVKERTFYRWISEGLLANHLAECREGRSKAAATMAAEAIPDIMGYMIEIASGKNVVRGANPIAAAQLVFTAAGVKTEMAPVSQPEIDTPTILAFMPQLVTFKVEHGSPVTEDGTLIIEGSAVDLGPVDKDPPVPEPEG